MSRARSIAIDHWGEEAPDWVLVLADACDTTSQGQVARDMDRSASIISEVLRNRYRGNMATIEERVRGALMAYDVDCPERGKMRADECQDWQRKSLVFSGANPIRRRMQTACLNCPRNPRGET